MQKYDTVIKKNDNTIQKHQHQQIIKTMIKYLYILFLFLFVISCSQNKQNINDELKDKDFSEKMKLLVLSEKSINQVYSIKLSDNENIIEEEIILLGEVTSKQYGVINIIYSTSFSGLIIEPDAKRANSTLSLYSDSKKIGHYFIGGLFDPVPKLIDEKVQFNTQKGCKKVTYIDFSDSIPKNIFIECREEDQKIYGDLFAFVKE